MKKQAGKIKARTVENGSTKKTYIYRDDAASPMAASDAIIITCVIEAKQGRDLMINNFPNAFVQSSVTQYKRGKRIIMKIQGALVDDWFQPKLSTFSTRDLI